ncbi:MAG: tehB [Candidatus Saccharibacteria bacterium]|nr:tehB [Candidatus Saccharibacteria bacterium]
MKTYVTSEYADIILASAETELLTHPAAAAVMKEFPQTFDIPTLPDGHRPSISAPVLEAVGHIGAAPKRILDLGSGEGTQGIYLATLGHDVTAIDSPSNAAYSNNWAQELGIQNNYRAFTGDARKIPSTEKFDVVMALSLLHFFDAADISLTVSGIQNATRSGGLNVFTVYGEDNPPQEMMPPRNLKQLFPRGMLRGMYGSNWQILRDEEGMATRAVKRDYLQANAVLIPTICELITRKTAEPAPVTSAISFNASRTGQIVIRR